MQQVLPDETEIIKLVLEVLIHSYHVQYYVKAFGEPCKDPQQPHDAQGKWNKLSWPVSSKLALQFRENGDKLYHDIIMEGVKLHRQQYHHIMWENPSQDVPEDSRKLSSADAICSMLEPLESRRYQGGVHTWEEIKRKIVIKSSSHQLPWMKYAFREMKKIKQPNLAEITCFSKIPKKGIDPEMYDAIIGRGHEALREFELDHGYNFYKNSESIIRTKLK